MTQYSFEHQLAIVNTHIDKAIQCLEYEKLDDAHVHLTIARVVRKGLEEKWDLQKKALLKSLNALTN